jgi:hypothetical protein
MARLIWVWIAKVFLFNDIEDIAQNSTGNCHFPVAFQKGLGHIAPVAAGW